MNKKTSEDCEPCCSRLIDENTEVLIDLDNDDDELTSSGISEDEEDDYYEEG